MKSTIIANLLMFFAICGCSRDDNPVGISKPAPEEPDASIVVANSKTLQAAALAFAKENRGVFPGTVDADASLAGNVVIDLLPRAQMLENSYTGSRDNPRNYSAFSSGEIGYTVIQLFPNENPCAILINRRT